MPFMIAPPSMPDRVEFTIVLTADPSSVRLPRKLTEWALESWGLGHAAGAAHAPGCPVSLL